MLCKKNTELDKVVLTIELSGDKLAKKSGDNLVVTWQQSGDKSGNNLVVTWQQSDGSITRPDDGTRN